MLFNYEDNNKKVFLETDGLPRGRVLAIIQELQGMLFEDDEAERAEEISTIEHMDLEPIEEEDDLIYQENQEETKAEKVWKGWPPRPSTIAEQVGEETAVALDSITVPPIPDEMVEAYQAAMPKIEEGRERLEEVRKERHEEATAEVQEIVEKLHANGANDWNYKISDDGRRVMYQCYYICPACKNRGKRFILKFAKTTTCHQCKKQMGIKPSIVGAEFPTVDQYGNIFVAGEWKPVTDPGETLLDEFKYARFGT